MTDAVVTDSAFDAPFHRDEVVRIGRAVHATTSFGCASARIVAHPNGEPDDERGRAFLAIDYPPHENHGDDDVPFEMFKPHSPGHVPNPGTWHWPRACPFDR